MAFSAKEICRIIEACEKHAVHELKLGDLSVLFKSGLQSHADQPKTMSSPIPSQQALDDSPVDITLDLQTKGVLEEAQRTQMLLDDPEAFEQEQIDLTLEAGDIDEREEETERHW